jgi:hypothetical protein
MARVIREGPAKPDDPIYSTGPIIGGKRIGKLVLMTLRPDMSREEELAVFKAFLKELGVPLKKPKRPDPSRP